MVQVEREICREHAQSHYMPSTRSVPDIVKSGVFSRRTECGGRFEFEACEGLQRFDAGERVFQKDRTNFGSIGGGFVCNEIDLTSEVFSWLPHTGAEAIDAFQQNWSEMKGYAFPPIAMIQRVLLKVKRERCQLVLVTPFWVSQAWFPAVFELTCEVPLLILAEEDLLTNEEGEDYPLVLREV